MLGGIGAALALQPVVPVLVHPLEMHWIAGVLLALEPIAGNLGHHHLAKSVLPGERLPDRQLRRRLGSHIGEQEAGTFLHRIGFSETAFTRAQARIDGVVIGLLDDAAAFIHQPAMIIATETGLLDKSIREVRAPVRAMTVKQSELSAGV